jgi:hypothetical protein
MITVMYRKSVPYPRWQILAQFFDLEHIEHVHPRTFGRARLISLHRGGVTWELESPRHLGVRTRSTIIQDYLPPDRIEARIIKGFLKGSEYSGIFREDGGATTVEETYHLPIPDWGWLRALVSTRLVRALERIWAEDLRVGVCHGGWPGLPKSMTHTPMAGP